MVSPYNERVPYPFIVPSAVVQCHNHGQNLSVTDIIVPLWGMKFMGEKGTRMQFIIFG